MGFLDAPGLNKSQFASAALTLLQGTYSTLRANGHSAAAGTGGSGGFPGSAGGRLAYNLLRTTLRGNPVGGAVLGIDGCESDPTGLNNTGTGVGGYARALKDFAGPGSSTLAAAITTTSATTITVNATNLQFPTVFTPPTVSGVAIVAPANFFTIKVDNEEMYCTLVDGTSWNATRTLTVTRGVNATTAAQHQAGAEVVQVLGRKGIVGVGSQQTSRPYLPWSVQGAGNIGQTLPFFWWDLNDFYFNCQPAFGSMVNVSNSTSNYSQALASYIHAYRRVISRALAASVYGAGSFRGALEAVGSLPAGAAGIYSSAGAQGNTGGWNAAVNVDANYLRRCSGNTYSVTATAGDFLELNGPTDLSADQAIVFGGIADHGDAGILTFTVDGTTVGTLDISTVRTPTAGYATGYCFRINESLMQSHGMSLVATNHRYRVTLTTSTSGHPLRIDSIDTESGQGAPVLVAGGFDPLDTNGVDGSGNATTTTYYTTLADRKTKDAAIAAAVDSLRAEFTPYSGLPNPVLKVDVMGVLGTNPALRFADGLHPNDKGYQLVAANAFNALVNFYLHTRDPVALLSA
jgi:hypothetical protein